MSNVNPVIYKNLDKHILVAAACGFASTKWPSQAAATEAIKIANAAKPVRDDVEVLKGRVQALRKAGKITYLPRIGWTLVSQNGGAA